MAVQPLNKRKIVKKIVKKVARFQSDRFDRVGVSNPLPILSFGPKTVS